MTHEHDYRASIASLTYTDSLVGARAVTRLLVHLNGDGVAGYFASMSKGSHNQTMIDVRLTEQSPDAAWALALQAMS